MSDVLVSAVPTEHISTLWPMVEGYVASAVEYTRGCYAPEDIQQQLLAGTHHLWIAFEGTDIKGCVVTQVVQYPRKRALNCYMAGGTDFSSWRTPMMALLSKFAIDNDCECFEATGRPGWLRMFKNEGCEVVWQTCQLPIARS